MYRIHSGDPARMAFQKSLRLVLPTRFFATNIAGIHTTKIPTWSIQKNCSGATRRPIRVPKSTHRLTKSPRADSATNSQRNGWIQSGRDPSNGSTQDSDAKAGERFCRRASIEESDNDEFDGALGS